MFQATKNTFLCNVDDSRDVVSGKQLHIKRKASAGMYFFNIVSTEVPVFLNVCVGMNEAVDLLR